jgi:uncharacterized membrane protein
MNRPAPRSIDEYLKQLRAALEGEDPALIQDALYDAEEYLRAEVGAHPGKSEADVLELIASTYGAPEEVAAAYLETEVKVKAALRTPPARPRPENPSVASRFFGVYSDPRAYTSLFYMLLAMVTGIIYFTFVVTGLAVSFGLAFLIIGLPLFLAFIGMTRVMSLGEGRLVEAITGERMPRRPVHPGPPVSFFARIGQMLKDPRTWTTLAYFVLMMPLGITYFTIAITMFSLGVSFIAIPVLELWDLVTGHEYWTRHLNLGADWLDNWFGYVLLGIAGVLLLTALMHLARGIGRVHGRLAKALLVTPGA